jgi:UPF0042 nucleotide-binding protein
MWEDILTMQSRDPNTQRVVLVTGPSGAGRATAINALEDFGFEAIDNIPLSLIPRLVEVPHPTQRPIALGIDTRNRDFNVSALAQMHDELSRKAELAVELLYLDCSVDVLERRYSETRRRHPMAPDGTPRDGILREMALLQDLRARADVVIDTTQLTVHELRETMAPWFVTTDGQRIALSVHSFSYKRGLPQGLDMAFDCRFLNNPHWQPDLREGTGLDPAVAEFVASDPRFNAFVSHILGLLRFIIPEAEAEGKAHLSIGFGCTGGRHRSVAMAQSVSASLGEDGWRVSTRHRELEWKGLVPVKPVTARQQEKAIQ